MTFRATIQNGIIKVPSGVDLPDGTQVHVDPVRNVKPKRRPVSRKKPATTKTRNARSKKLPPGKKDPFFTIGDNPVNTGIRDMARQHDHYAWGSPKRKDA